MTARGYGDVTVKAAGLWEKRITVSSPRQRAAVVRLVAAHARDTTDLLDLLWVLGLSSEEGKR